MISSSAIGIRLALVIWIVSLLAFEVSSQAMVAVHSQQKTSPPPSSDDSQEHIDVSSTVRGRGRGRGRARGRGRGRGRHTTTEARPTSSDEALLNIEQRKVTLRAMIEQMNDTEKNDQLLKIIENQPSLVFNLAVPQPQQPGVGGYHPSESSSKPDWCVCTFCREMPTQPERKCCDRPHEFCMSQSPVTEHKWRIFRRDVQEETEPLDIESLHVTSSITARYSKSVTSSRMTNDESQSKEAIFKMLLPETAFISNFSMEIGGIMYYGVVKDKVQAQKEYDRAKEEGRTAGQVAAEQASRGFTPFTISVNVAAQSSVTFTLVYEELLQRRRGIYEHRTSIRPGQVISDLKIDVFLIEPAGILSLIVPKIQTTDSESVPDNEELTMATVTTSADDKSAHIYYYPSEQQQRAESEDGIMGTFLVRYDVTHHYDAGEIWVIGDYFVHFFAPPSSSNQLSVFPKNVVFVIDVSGSMSGTKLEQTKDAMQSILQDLRESDRFNILIFSDEVMQWRNNELVSATTSNVNTAKSYVEKLETIGGTNINDGLLEAIRLLRRNSNQAQRAAELIIMLTDGEPTSGVTNKKDIRKNVQGINEGQFAIFCLGFGAHVDFEFLEALSYENNGVARKIYEDADASIQLTGFFDEVALPLLLDVNINYLDNTVTMTTMSTFPNYFSGSEIVVAGKIADGNSIGEVKTAVTAVAVSENIELTADKNRNDVPAILTGTDAVDEFTQRLWVYLTINQLILESRAMEENSVEKNATIAKALVMSLEYNLVTELTSMIVIGPDLNNTGIDGDQLEWVEDGILFSRGAGVQPKLMAGSSGSAMYLLATVNLIISMIIYFIL